MKEFESIRKDIKNRKFSPIYFLYGDESFFIDGLTSDLQKYVLKEEEKAFNEHIFYANEIDMKDIVLQARQYPMMSEFQLIVVKEAQNLKLQLDDLTTYAQNPLASTVLVFNYKHAKPDGRMAVIKHIKKHFVLAESARLRDYQILPYIEKLAKSKGLTFETKAKSMLAENIGEDLSRIHNEMDKLAVLLKDDKMVTSDLVEKHIGISKDYNSFELTKSFSEGNIKRSFEIVKYFGQNPKDNPIFKSLAVVFNYFSNLMIYHALQDKSPSNVASVLKINPYFVGEYQKAAKNFPLRKVTRIITYLRETDVRAKGVGSTGNVTEEELLTELIYKIYYL